MELDSPGKVGSGLRESTDIVEDHSAVEVIEGIGNAGVHCDGLAVVYQGFIVIFQSVEAVSAVGVVERIFAV